MNVARINTSYGTYAEHEEHIRRVRRATEVTGQAIIALVDLQGPKIRLGHFAGGPHDLTIGDILSATTEDVLGTRELVSTTYEGSPSDCKPDDRILIDNGKVTTCVLDVTDMIVRIEVIVSGPVSNNRDANLPSVTVSILALSEKGREDPKWGLNFSTDSITLSLTRTSSDADDVHEIMDQAGTRHPVIAKIGKPQTVESLEGVVRAFDGIMIARDDLGIEFPLEQVPLMQKRAISLARRRSKLVIVVTQVFDSMVDNLRPTRVEALDYTNVVMDGTNAVMLSGETSIRKFPIECVETMSSVIECAGKHGMEQIPLIGNPHRTRNGAITRITMEIGEALGVRGLVVFAETGQTA